MPDTREFADAVRYPAVVLHYDKIYLGIHVRYDPIHT
jgi:hypothetical protein